MIGSALKWLVILAIGAVALLMMLNSAAQSTSKYRFRLQVELDTPEGRKTGSSVIEVLVRNVTWGPPESKITSRTLKGEAVYFDLGNGKNLVATLTTGAQGEDEENRFERIAELAVQSATGKYPDPMNMANLTGALKISDKALPTFVTIRDVKDGFSAKPVNVDDFGTVFGNGVRFVSVKVIFTSDKPKFTIHDKLPFLEIQSEKVRGLYRDFPYTFQPQPYYFVRE